MSIEYLLHQGNFGSYMYFFLSELWIKSLINVSKIYNIYMSNAMALKMISDGNTVSETIAET